MPMRWKQRSYRGRHRKMKLITRVAILMLIVAVAVSLELIVALLCNLAVLIVHFIE